MTREKGYILFLMSATTVSSIRKGKKLRRKCDGFVFNVESVSRTTRHASMQCVDAARIFMCVAFNDIVRDFEVVS